MSSRGDAGWLRFCISINIRVFILTLLAPTGLGIVADITRYNGAVAAALGPAPAPAAAPIQELAVGESKLAPPAAVPAPAAPPAAATAAAAVPAAAAPAPAPALANSPPQGLQPLAIAKDEAEIAKDEAAMPDYEWETHYNSSEWNNAPVNHAAIPAKLDDTLTASAMDVAEPDFDELDCVDHDGNATMDEVATFALKVGVPWSQAKVLFDIIDTDHDNIITHKEFHNSLPVSEVITENLRTGFREIDFDGDNLISHDEWIAYCSGWLTPKVLKATCEDLFKTADYEEPKGFIDDIEFQAGGERCQSVDDGDCSLLAISSRRAIANRAIFIATGHHKQIALLDDGKQATLLRGASTKNKMPRALTGGQLFGLLLRRFHRKTSA